ncbi:hypothetical protein [Chryseobacterium shigense]|uniref:IPT/TIG domain-containing protein n=1 Tax=Chryseobacterium shigense TaxID=297244 RepID=A0A841N6P6_9FLAO|nr:hypothetical protein [Chryseobacterium shigense]MBB6370381.1 hypothetical protein [Chryseobacterium shigense]
MMKKMLFLSAFSISAAIYSQVGINTSNPQGALDVVSNTGSFIPPRMTTEQRDVLLLPPAGSIIFNTTTNGLEFNYGTPSSPTWKTPLTSATIYSNIVAAGGSSAPLSPNANPDTPTTNGNGNFTFILTLPAAAKCKLDLYPTGWSSAATGVGTVLYIDGVPSATFSTTTASPSNLHVVVPYSYVTPANLGSGSHTVKVQSSGTSKIDANDKMAYSYMCWN